MEASIDTPGSHRDIQSALRIWPIIKEAIQIPWIRRQHFWPLLALPVAMTTLLYLGNYWFLLRDGTRSIGILLQIPNFLIFSFFAVACHRSILIGEHSVSRFGIPGWPRREFRFFCWLIFIYVIGGMFWLVTSEVVIRSGFIETVLGEDLNELSIRLPGTKTSVRFSWTFLGLIPCGYLIGRLSLLLPAIAVNEQVSLRSAWSQSKGNGWRMALLVGWMPILFHLLTQILAVYFDWQVGNAFTTYRWGVYLGICAVSQALFRYTFFTIEVTILSLSFRKLSGWHTQLAPQSTTIDPLRPSVF